MASRRRSLSSRSVSSMVYNYPSRARDDNPRVERGLTGPSSSAGDRRTDDACDRRIAASRSELQDGVVEAQRQADLSQGAVFVGELAEVRFGDPGALDVPELDDSADGVQELELDVTLVEVGVASTARHCLQ